MASVEMTPQDEEILTPLDIWSPDVRRQQMLLFEHTGLSCRLPFEGQPGAQRDISITSQERDSDDEKVAPYPDYELEADSDEFELFSRFPALERKRAVPSTQDEAKVAEKKRLRVA